MKFKHFLNCHECLFSIVPPLDITFENGHFTLAQTIESLKIGKSSYIVWTWDESFSTQVSNYHKLLVQALNWSSSVREALECYSNQGFVYGLLQSLLTVVLTVVHKSRTFNFLVLMLLSCTSSIRIFEFSVRFGSYYPLGLQTIYKFKGCQYSKSCSK